MVNVTETNRKPIVRVDELEDGSGVSHTGELADIADLPGFSVSDDGTVTVDNPTDVNAGTNLTATDDGDGTVTFDAIASGGLSEYSWTFYVYNDGGTITVLDSSGATVNTSNSISTALQYTNDNLPVSGGTVVLSDDQYTQSTEVDITSAGYTLKQIDGGRITIDADIYSLDVNADNVTIDGIEWRGQANSDTGGRFLNTSNSSDTERVGLTIRECDLRQGTLAGLITGVSDLEIVDNTVADFSQYGLHYNPNGTVTPSNAIIQGNFADNLGYNAISVYNDATDVTISDNVVQNTGHSGIAVSTGERVAVTGNVVRDVTNNSEAGIEVEFKDTHGDTASRDVTVTGNTVDNCTWGVFVGDRDATDAPENVTVTANTLTNCGTALFLREGSNITDVANTFRGNTTDKDISGATDVYQTIGDGDNAGRDIYVIANGANDPADADAEDLIYEEEP